jgi:hypothetical protein
MNIDLTHTQEQLFDAIRRYLKFELSSEDFCLEFTKLWIHYRDEQYEIKSKWADPADERLFKARFNGEITEDEFSKAYKELWGIAFEFVEMVDAIHSACSSYNPSPEMEWEINGEQLRSEVQLYLDKYTNNSKEKADYEGI